MNKFYVNFWNIHTVLDLLRQISQEMVNSMPVFIFVNHALALGVEIAVLIGVFRAGLRLAAPASIGWALAFLFLIVVVLLWARFAAPTSTTRLQMPWLLFFKSLVFVTGAASIWYSFGPIHASLFLGCVAVHLPLATRLGIL